jgi:transcriptional regulator with XRE-family HTH domain
MTRKRKPGQLHTAARKLLISASKDMDIQDIAKALGISANWLWKFRGGLIPEPGVNKVEALYLYLAKAPFILRP